MAKDAREEEAGTWGPKRARRWQGPGERRREPSVPVGPARLEGLERPSSTRAPAAVPPPTSALRPSLSRSLQMGSLRLRTPGATSLCAGYRQVGPAWPRGWATLALTTERLGVAGPRAGRGPDPAPSSEMLPLAPWRRLGELQSLVTRRGASAPPASGCAHGHCVPAWGGILEHGWTQRGSSLWFPYKDLV